MKLILATCLFSRLALFVACCQMMWQG